MKKILKSCIAALLLFLAAAHVNAQLASEAPIVKPAAASVTSKPSATTELQTASSLMPVMPTVKSTTPGTTLTSSQAVVKPEAKESNPKQHVVIKPADDNLMPKKAGNEQVSSASSKPASLLPVLPAVSDQGGVKPVMTEKATETKVSTPVPVKQVESKKM